MISQRRGTRSIVWQRCALIRAESPSPRTCHRACNRSSERLDGATRRRRRHGRRRTKHHNNRVILHAGTVGKPRPHRAPPRKTHAGEESMRRRGTPEPAEGSPRTISPIVAYRRAPRTFWSPASVRRRRGPAPRPTTTPEYRRFRLRGRAAPGPWPRRRPLQPHP